MRQVAYILIIIFLVAGNVLAHRIEIKTGKTPSYARLQNSPWAVRNSWNLPQCGFQAYACYSGDSVDNLIEADLANGLISSWAFLTVQKEADIDKFAATKMPVAVYGMIPDIINNWVQGNEQKQKYLDYIDRHITRGHSVGVCEWENSFYRWFADSTDTKANYGYSHQEMAGMSKNEIYTVIRSAMLRWKKDTRNKMMIANANGIIGHLAEIGVDLVGIETSECIPSTQFKRAVTRGAARQFGIPWYEEVSAWFGQQITAGQPQVGVWPYSPGVRYGGYAGHSMSHMKRIRYSSWFSGAGHIMQEASAQVFYESPWTDPEYVPKKPKLSRFGIEAKKAMQLWSSFDRGIPYTPFLVIIGKSAGRWTVVEKPFGILQPNEADLMVNKFMDQIYIGQSLGVGEEERYLCPSPYGDTFDVMINDAKRDAWKSYPVIFAVGEIFWTNDDAETLRNHVKQGGILVINELNAKGLESHFPNIRNAFIGKNVVLNDNKTPILGECKLRKRTAYPNELLSALYKAYIPFTITGKVETLINKTPDGWAVMVINNNGISKPLPYAELETIDPSQAQTISISFAGTTSKVSDVMGNDFRVTTGAGNTRITSTINPGDFAIFSIRY
jgi:hypothetical protein